MDTVPRQGAPTMQEQEALAALFPGEDDFGGASLSGEPEVLERQLQEALVSGYPLALHDAVEDARRHQLDTPLLQQAADRLAVAQQRAVVALTEAHVRCQMAPSMLDPEALAALDAAANWAFDTGATVETSAGWAFDVEATVDKSIRDRLRAAGYRW